MAWRTLVVGRSLGATLIRALLMALALLLISQYVISPVRTFKRVVGLPRERIAITDGVVLVNGVPLDEPYVTERDTWNVQEAQLGSHEYYVIGDNRGMPAHLHDFGRVARSRIAGRVLHSR